MYTISVIDAKAKIVTISLLLLFINFTKGNPAGLNCLDKKGKSTPFVTRHCHVDTFDGDGAVCVVDGVQCEEVIVVRRGYSSPDLHCSCLHSGHL